MLQKSLVVFSILLLSANAVANTALVTEAEIPGGSLRITILEPVDDAKARQLVKWLQAASSNVALAYGRFPNPDASVVVRPVGHRAWSSRSPVPFGRVTRTRGEQVELFIDADRPIEDFYGDWTATHEFSHLLLPYISQRHRWISEGFASYYQNVLMSRGGHYTETEAWTKLTDGLARGQRSRPELSPNEAAAEGIRRARMKIYWSGAAIALLADVELRERSGGRESLDTALDGLQRCCLPSSHTWSGPELFAKLDEMVEQPVFMSLYRRYANSAGFPDVEPLLRRLGIENGRGSTVLAADAELAAVRDAITARHGE